MWRFCEMNQQFETSERKNNIFVRAEARKLYFLPTEEVNTGILEGSVFGPLLFLVYTNDLTDGLLSNAKLFTSWPLFMDGVRLPQGYNHFEEAVYFLPFSSEKFLVLILSNSEG